jgi:hypothetical protein
MSDSHLAGAHLTAANRSAEGVAIGLDFHDGICHPRLDNKIFALDKNV